MKMTIDEHMKQLKKLKSFHNGSYGASINFALDTICKYQEIRKIYMTHHYTDEEVIEKIKEVINGDNNK